MSDTPLPALSATEGAALPASVTRQAVQWLVALQADDACARTQADWQRWHDAHPDHGRAWRRIEQFGAQMQHLDTTVAHGVLARPASRGRRQTLKHLALLTAVAGGAYWSLRDTSPLRSYVADYRTTTGQHRTVTLADGSQIVLNTDSAIDVQFDARWRRVVLRCGEILVTTAHDPQATDDTDARPFVVTTPHGRLRALGTRFSVRKHDDHTDVQVFAHAVEVMPADGDGLAHVLPAGQQLRFNRVGFDAPQPVGDEAAAWASGTLVAHAMPLAHFIAELARYRTGRLLCDPAVAHLPISGVYPLADTDRVLDMLVRTQPVKLSQRTRYWVTVQAR